MLNRSAYKTLLAWKNREPRKPLIIRGARQVGKSTLVHQFSKEFDSYISLNLEKEHDKQIFEIGNIHQLISAAALLKNQSIIKGSTLLFIDEIQESPKAIQILRFFYEEVPEIYVIAAGSLLEFSLDQIKSFPVGRVAYLYLHPINFQEYLHAINHEQGLELLQSVPIPEFAYEILLNLFNEYAIIGGMPEIVYEYTKHKNLQVLNRIYSQLWISYLDDVEKYSKNDTDKKVIRHVIKSAPNELDRIKFEGFGNSNYKSREVGEALRSLDKSALIKLIYPTTSVNIPIAINYKKRPRLQFLDTGLLNQILTIQGPMIALKDLNQIYKGKIIQHLFAQEVISTFSDTPFTPHFWVRQESGSSSEVDLIFQFQNYMIPIEVKSGKQGTLRSLHQFIDRTKHHYAIRAYAGKFSIEQHKTPSGKSFYLMNVPYFLGTYIKEYIEYFLSNY